MKRWRQKQFPKQPKTILGMGTLLGNNDNKKLLDYGKGTLQSVIITDADGCNHLLLFDQQLINEEFKNVPNSRAWIDGTFKTTVKLDDAYQHATVMVSKYDHVSKF